jgi:phenylacetate-CoA ligase
MVLSRHLAFHLQYLRALKGMRARPRLTRSDIEVLQLSGLQQLIAHAYANVPYYRQLFDRHGIDPDEIRSTEDLCRVPITSKRDLQLQPPRNLVARGVDPERLIAVTTNGSSGQPFTVRRTWLEQNWLHTFRLRAHHYFGRRMSDRMVRVACVRSVDPRDSKLLGRALGKLHIYRLVEVSTLLEPDDILARLRNLRPDVLNGYPGILARLMGLMGEQDRQAIRPRFVLTGAEVLTQQQRAQIVRGLGVPVFDMYGCAEFNLVGWECKDTGQMHTCDDAVIVEVVQDGRPVATGERGELVATSLYSYAMPLIRYRLDDVVTKGCTCCPCGQPYSTVHAVQGRVAEHFLLPSGRMIHPFEISQVIRGEPGAWVAQYQLIQERQDLIVLQVVPLAAPSPERLASLANSVSALVGSDMKFEIRLVGDILPEKGGKYRLYRSLLR